MKNKKRNRKKQVKNTVQKEVRKFPVKKLLILLASFTVIFSVYQIAIHFYAGWIVHVYCISAGVIAIAYIIINRGMMTKPVRENLPDGWSDEKKDSFIEEQIKRRKNSSFLLYILIPLILTIVFDMVYIYLTCNMGLKL